MESVTVGHFTLDEADVLTGPADYMAEQGNAWVDCAIAGNDPGFNAIMSFAPAGQDFRTTFLVGLQTDYAGWHGMKRTFAELGI